MLIGIKELKLLSFVFYAVFISGCASYGTGFKQGMGQMQKGNFKQAADSFAKQLKPDGDERLLYYMELGLLNYLDGKYEESNRLLSQAEIIADELYTKRVGDLLSVAMSNPLFSPYTGASFERVQIHYYKSLNYLLLSQLRQKNGSLLLESALVEARKVDILLNDIASQESSYQEQQDQKSSIFSRTMDVLDKINDRQIKTEDLVYREDAYIRYMIGLIYELNGERDDARISYEKAAVLFESGYADQFSLGVSMTERAWFDTLRMMRLAGGYGNRIGDLSAKKLSPALQQELSHVKKGPDLSELILIQHSGNIPQREELNLRMYINRATQSLIFEPVLTGTKKQRNSQMAWFRMLYADRGILDAMKNYKLAGAVSGVITAMGGSNRKSLNLTLVWGLVEQLKLHEYLGGAGIRVTVPYYPQFEQSKVRHSIVLNGQNSGEMTLSQSLRDIAVQNQLFNASSDLNEAMGREIVKLATTGAVLKEVGGGMLGTLGAQLLTSATSSAETRNWVTLPGQIEIFRQPIAAGLHRVGIKDLQSRKMVFEQNRQFISGRPVVIVNRTF